MKRYAGSLPTLRPFGLRNNRGIWYWSVRLRLRDWFRWRFLEYSYYSASWSLRKEWWRAHPTPAEPK